MIESGSRWEPPLDPTAPEAKDLILRELAKPEYTAARPTWFDRATSEFWDWLQSLEVVGASGPSAFGVLVFVGLLVIGIIVAFLVFGLPRLNRRTSVGRDVFGEDDARTADELRTSAHAAASGGDLDLAVIEMFRALVRGLHERTIVASSPGMTADSFATRAGLVFPQHTVGLIVAARAFDDVRYLGQPATTESWGTLRELDDAVQRTSPTFESALL